MIPQLNKPFSPAEMHGVPASGASGHAGLPAALGINFSYAQGEEIFGEAEPAEFVYRVVKGTVRTYRTLSDGRRQISAFHLEGDIFGLEGGPDHMLSAEAVVDTQVVVYKRRTLEHLAARDAEIANAMWSVTARGLRHAGDHMVMLGRKGALERLAAFLLEMSKRCEGRDLLKLEMPRRDIADYLGLTIETISRGFSSLHEQGLVDLDGARRVTLRDRGGLEDLSA